MLSRFSRSILSKVYEAWIFLIHFLVSGDMPWGLFSSLVFLYHNDPLFSDRYAWANSADPDQTAPRGAV